VNSVIELKDFKSLAVKLARAVASREAFYNAVRRGISSFRPERIRRGATLRGAIGGSANGYLQWSFAWAPLIADISAVQQNLRSLRKTVDEIVSKEGRRLVRHFSVPITEYSDSETYYTKNPWSYYGTKNDLLYRRRVKYPTAKFTVTVEYSYKIPDWVKEDLYLRAALDAFGLQVNPAIVWNALPWSFVVDWFTGLGRWIDQFKIRNFETNTHITRCCISSHVERRIETTLQVVNHPAFGHGTGEVPVCTVAEESYFRTPYVPDMLRSIQLSGLNSREFTLAGSLGVARWR